MKQLIPFLLLSLFTSCATKLDYKMPINRMMSPENTGKPLGFRGQLQYLGSQRVELAGVADYLFSSATITTNESIDRSRGLGIHGDIGLHEKVDFYYSDSNDAAQLFGLKFQVLGSTFQERKADTFALSLAAAYGGGSTDELPIVTDDGASYNTELDLSSYELMLLMGYRTDKKILFYLNLLKSGHKVDAALKQNGIASKQINGDSTMAALNLGAQLSKDDGSIFGHVEVGYGYGNFESSLKKHSLTYAFSIGISQ